MDYQQCLVRTYGPAKSSAVGRLYRSQTDQNSWAQLRPPRDAPAGGCKELAPGRARAISPREA